MSTIDLTIMKTIYLKLCGAKCTKFVLICFLQCCFTSLYTHAQTWQWAEQGGSVSGFPNNQSLEDVVDMLTDEHGNVYVLSLVNGNSDPKIGDQVFTGYGSMDIMLASFSCDGTLRWAKTIGGQNTDAPFALGIDSLNQIYVYGRVTATVNPMFGQTPVHIDSDSILSWTRKTRFFAIYDTSGILNNFYMYEPDTFDLIPSANLAILSRDFSVAPNGDIYLLGYIQRAGIDYGNGFFIASEGWYILRYEQGHILAGVFPLEIELERLSYGHFNYKFTRDHQSGNFYISGTFNTLSANHPLIIGGDTINNWAVAAAFNAQGEYLWHRTNSSESLYTGFRSRPILDEDGNILLTGATAQGDIFGNHVSQNTVSNFIWACPFVVKLDADGNNIWAVNGSGIGSQFGNSLALSGNDVYLATFGTNTTSWINDLHVTYDLNYPYALRMSATTGTPIEMAFILPGEGIHNQASAIASFGYGNVYIGGRFSSTMEFNDSITLHNSGAGTDWFIAKYGYPCDCDPPNAGFSFEIQELEVSFELDDPAGLLTSDWVFGDGLVSGSISPQHLYSQPGSYIVCVDVENDCGTRRFCDRVTVCLMPDAQFTHTFSETGSTMHLSIPDTSVTQTTWNFGDGQTGEGNDVSHTYTAEGVYNVCATVTSPCGTETHCEEITVVFVNTTQPGIFSEVNIFPNPVKHKLHLHNLPEGTQYRIYSITGREIHLHGSPAVLSQNAVLDVSILPPGSYILRLIVGNQESRNFLIQVGG